MAQPWGAGGGATGWAAGVAAALEAAARPASAPTADAGVASASAAAAVAAAAAATAAAWPGTPWPDPISPTELGALIGQWQNGAAPQPQPLPPSDWRCLDRGHDAGCTSCTPPPAAAEYEWFELVGESGKKNGEKKLRSLLAITAEWNSASERLTTAVAAEAVGMPELGAALRAKRCACLRKKHFLFLCESWRYRSDVWARKGGTKRRGGGDAPAGATDAAAEGPRTSQRRRVATARAADADVSPPPRLTLPARLLMPLPPALLPPGAATQRAAAAAAGGALLPSATQPEGAWMIVASQLRPLSLEAAQLLWGEQARAAATAPGAAPLVSRSALEAVAALRRDMCDAALYAGTLHSGTIAAFMQLPAPGGVEVSVPATGRSDAELYLSTRLLTWLRRAMGVHASRAAEAGTSHTLLTWLGELHRACALLAAAAEHAAGMLRSARAPGASLGAALKVECIALEWLAATACSAHAALLLREAWMAQLLEASAAAGEPQAQAPLLMPDELPRPGELVPLAARARWRRSSAGAAGAAATELQQPPRRPGLDMAFLPDALFADE